MGKNTFEEEYHLFIGDIRSPIIVEGTYCPVNERLIQDINMNPNKSMDLFDIHTEKKSAVGGSIEIFQKR